MTWLRFEGSSSSPSAYLAFLAMSSYVPLLLPNKFKTLFLSLHQDGVPYIALARISQYLWSSEVACVASRDGYLRLLFNDMSFVFEKLVGPEAVWCLCAGWNNLYVSLFGGGLKAFAFDDSLQLRYRLACNFTFLCLCCTTRNVCAGSDHGTLYVCAPCLTTLQVIHVSWQMNSCRELNCCIPLRGMLLVGTQNGELFRALELPSHSFARLTRPGMVKHYPASGIFSMCFSEKHNLIFVGLEYGADAICPVTFDSIFRVPFPNSVWSLSTKPGSDVILLGTQIDGVMAIQLDRQELPEIRAYTISPLDYWPEIGTCSAISYASDGSWYAASNRSLLYHCSTFGVLSSRSIAMPVLEAEDTSGIPRSDIYDVSVVSAGAVQL